MNNNVCGYSHIGDFSNDIYCSIEISPHNPQGDKDEGRVQFRRVPAQACLSGVPQHKKEMDHALGELVLDRSATMYKVRGSV